MEQTAQAQINCPTPARGPGQARGTPIDVNKVLFEKVRSEIGQQYESTIAKEREKLAAEKKKLVEQQQQLDAKVKEAVDQQVAGDGRCGLPRRKKVQVRVERD